MDIQTLLIEIQELFLFVSVLAWVVFPLLIYSSVKYGNQQRRNAKEASTREEIQKSINKSQNVKHGQKAEQFMPFMSNFPYDPQEFKFLGKPIDGVVFEDDKIVLIEFKTGKSNLNARQRNIRKLAKKGKVEFEMIRL